MLYVFVCGRARKSKRRTCVSLCYSTCTYKTASAGHEWASVRATLWREVKRAFVFMWTADMQDLCKSHLSSGVTSALCLSGIQKKNCLCCQRITLIGIWLFFTAASNEYLWRQLMLIRCFLFWSLFPIQAPDCSDWNTWLRTSFSNVQPNDNMHKLMECMFVQSKTYLNRNTVKYTLESILHHLYINLCRWLTQASLHAWALGVISTTTPIKIFVQPLLLGDIDWIGVHSLSVNTHK